MNKSRASFTQPSVTGFTGKDGIERLKAQWLDLETRVGDIAHYHTHAWYEAAVLSGLIEASAAVFVAARQDDKLVAVLPLELGNDGKGAVTIRLPQNPHLLLKDVIIDAGVDHGSVLEAMLKWMRRQKEFRWDTLCLQKLPDSSALRRIAVDANVQCIEESEGMSAIVACEGTEDENLAHLPGKFRRNLGRLERKAQKLGDVRVVTFTRDSGGAEAIREFIRIENASWKGESGTSIASDDMLVDFYTRLINAEHRLVECRINLLKVGDQYVAGQFGFVAQDTLRVLKIGYLQERADIGPGTLMWAVILRQLSDDPAIRRVDLVTAQEWSRVWTTHLRPVHRVTVFNRTLPGLLQFSNKRLKGIARRLWHARRRQANSGERAGKTAQDAGR